MTHTPEDQRLLIARMIRRRNNGGTAAPVVLAGSLKVAPITTRYRVKGPQWALGYHTGEDHACPVGSLALATSWGEVVYASGRPGGMVTSWGPSYGLHIIVRTRDGRFDYMHAHLSRVLHGPGTQVAPGMVLGYVGSTGNSTGPHTHFEARPAGGRYGSDVHPVNVKRKRLLP
jgi:murein DD-endopeptidase MepM/ murein hydrolase activator NlpD